MSRPKGSKLTEEHRKRISESQKGKNGYWYGKKMSEETRAKMRERRKLFGEDNPAWKGEGISYEGIHAWLERKYGKPKRCDNNLCRYKNKLGEVKRFDWALLPGKKYERSRKNFIRICRSCHILMDKNWLGKKIDA